MNKIFRDLLIIIYYRSKLASSQITEIIISMLTAAGIDPATHVQSNQDVQQKQHQQESDSEEVVTAEVEVER